ncbi:hypothetical protein BKA56DRAFT_236695 [Ilyonectria sp. MPI-CAGE-AT-0026]|nr:hypothetical protein BKA56DRAFT_236695 [Ilyonectria sp. MPI-CAGE-AT-0026]
MGSVSNCSVLICLLVLLGTVLNPPLRRSSLVSYKWLLGIGNGGGSGNGQASAALGGAGEPDPLRDMRNYLS